MTAMGDVKAFEKKLDEVRGSHPRGTGKVTLGDSSASRVEVPTSITDRRPRALPTAKPEAAEEEEDDEDEEEDEMAPVPSDFDETDPDLVTAYNQLSPSEKVYGEFSLYQLLTHALLHGGFWHLAGNLLFFLVFGLAVNGLVGNIGTAIIYPLLAIFAGIAHYIDQQSGTASPMLGASGAIMGMAGMYFVFFPVHRVHVAVFIRPWPFAFIFFFISIFLLRYIVYVFKIYMKLFACRGFWILLFYIGWDVYYTISKTKDGTAHWAHLGGFLAGMAIALILVITRGVNCRGGDLLTVVFGKYAWPLVGKPSQWAERGSDEGWLQRLKIGG